MTSSGRSSPSTAGSTKRGPISAGCFDDRLSSAAPQKLAQVLVLLGRTDEANKELEMAKTLDRSLGGAPQ